MFMLDFHTGLTYIGRAPGISGADQARATGQVLHGTGGHGSPARAACASGRAGGPASSWASPERPLFVHRSALTSSRSEVSATMASSSLPAGNEDVAFDVQVGQGRSSQRGSHRRPCRRGS